jgi:hypothetical protein
LPSASQTVLEGREDCGWWRFDGLGGRLLNFRGSEPLLNLFSVLLAIQERIVIPGIRLLAASWESTCT